ncbi:MAG: ABC transporter permease [Planctomycetota bacterium]|nr:ABC transporter permease [Planctomycetota bacterium]
MAKAPLRSGATILGVGAIAALACAALHLAAAGRHLAAAQPGEPLITMQAGRICPSTSHLPMSARDTIAAVPGVASVSAQQVAVSDCKVSTTATTFRGVNGQDFWNQHGARIRVLAGTPTALATQPGAALVGEQVARSRQLALGDSFESAGITVTVAAIIDGERMQDRASVWVDHATLEQALPALRDTATLFEIQGAVGQDPEQLAERIDAALGGLAHTAPFSATAARVTGSLAASLQSGGTLALAAAIAGILLLANAALLSLRSAGRDLTVLRAIGHPRSVLAGVASIEGGLLGLLGGAGGALLAGVLVHCAATVISTEGISVGIELMPGLVATVGVAAALCGLLATLVPAWWAARGDLHRALGASA